MAVKVCSRLRLLLLCVAVLASLTSRSISAGRRLSHDEILTSISPYYSAPSSATLQLLNTTAVMASALLPDCRGFSDRGPYAVSRPLRKKVQFAADLGLPESLDVTLTYPLVTNQTAMGSSGSDSSSGDSAFPLVIFFSGWDCDPSWYSEIVDHIASWGYVVLQYIMDWEVVKELGETGEMPYLAPLLEWLGNQTLDGTKAHVDFTRKAVMGHSRGGKLAAVHYANNSNPPGGITTAVLLDPVDCILSGRAYPSAAAKLLGIDRNCGDSLELPQRRSKLAAAIMGAGVTSSECNPPHTSYQSFVDVMSLDSWNILIINGGHMSFAASNDPAYCTKKNICGAGEVSSQVVMWEASTMAVGWLESVFRLSEDTRKRLAAYKQHLQDQSAAGILTCKLPDRDFFYPEK